MGDIMQEQHINTQGKKQLKVQDLKYPDGTSISGKDISRVLNAQMMFKEKHGVHITLATMWTSILDDDAKAREPKVCSTDNKDDCEGCGS